MILHGRQCKLQKSKSEDCQQKMHISEAISKLRIHETYLFAEWLLCMYQRNVWKQIVYIIQYVARKYIYIGRVVTCVVTLSDHTWQQIND